MSTYPPFAPGPCLMMLRSSLIMQLSYPFGVVYLDTFATSRRFVLLSSDSTFASLVPIIVSSTSTLLRLSSLCFVVVWLDIFASLVPFIVSSASTLCVCDSYPLMSSGLDILTKLQKQTGVPVCLVNLSLLLLRLVPFERQHTIVKSSWIGNPEFQIN